MFKSAWKQWMRIAMVIGNFISRYVLTIIYAIVVLPFGLVVRIFGDPLAIRGKRSSAWTDIKHPTRTIEEGRKQF